MAKLHDDDLPLGPSVGLPSATIVADLLERRPTLKVVLHEGHREFFLIEAPEPLGDPANGIATMEAAIRARFDADQAGHDDACLLAAARDVQDALLLQGAKLTDVLAKAVGVIPDSLFWQLEEIGRKLAEAAEMADRVEIIPARG